MHLPFTMASSQASRNRARVWVMSSCLEGQRSDWKLAACGFHASVMVFNSWHALKSTVWNNSCTKLAVLVEKNLDLLQ